MKGKYKNEANNLFDKCSKNENIMLIIYIINIVFMLLLTLNITNEIWIDILNYGLIAINIVYIFLSGFNDVFLKNKAENELRKTMIANSFNVNITTTKADDYYSNSIRPSIERLGVNSFESTLYTKKITEKLIYRKLFKFIMLLVMWIIIITKVTNIERTVILTQLIFSADILLDLIKTIYYHINVNILFNNFYKIFVTDGYKEKEEPIIIEYVMEYECLKSYCHIILPNNIFDLERDLLEKKWNEIKSNFDKNKEVN